MAKANANIGAPLTSSRSRSGSGRGWHSFSAANLSHMVESEIIPRLLMAHGTMRSVDKAPLAVPEQSGAVLSPDEIARFGPLPLVLEAEELRQEVEKFLARGVSMERILIDLLAPSARQLGELWEEDACDFVDVTMGLWRLQEVMRSVAMKAPPVMRPLQRPPSALFAPMPGDDHSFGALMIEEIFARAGWETDVVYEPNRARTLDLLAARSFDLVGLTVTTDCPSGVLADLISAIRSVSRNSAIRVLVGGRAINADPALSVAAGADGTAPDADAALILAQEMVTGSQSAAAQT